MKEMTLKDLITAREKHELFLSGDKENGQRMDQGLLHEVELDSLIFPDLLNYDFYSGQKSTFKNVVFNGVIFNSKDFAESKFNQCVFLNCSIIKSDFYQTHFNNCSFINSKLFRSKLMKAQLKKCLLTNCDMDKVVMSESIIENCLFVDYIGKPILSKNKEVNVIWIIDT